MGKKTESKNEVKDGKGQEQVPPPSPKANPTPDIKVSPTKLTEEERMMRAVREATDIAYQLNAQGVIDESGPFTNVKSDNITAPSVEKMMNEARKSGNYTTEELMKLQQRMERAERESTEAKGLLK